MQTKSLLYGLIGFFMGGLLVATAATTIESPGDQPEEMSMSQMTSSLRDKSGDDYDKAFITHMIDHHQAAVDMARLSSERAKHQEIKDLSDDIADAQEKEIMEMMQWRQDWGYASPDMPMAH